MIKELATAVAIMQTAQATIQQGVPEALEGKSLIVEGFDKVAAVRRKVNGIDSVLFDKSLRVIEGRAVTEESEEVHIEEEEEEDVTVEEYAIEEIEVDSSPEEYTTEEVVTEVPLEAPEVYVQEEFVEEVTPIVPATDLTADQYSVLIAVVRQEGGDSYESAYAVMSTIVNRVNQGGWGSGIWGVITAPGQFEAYGAGHYYRHLGVSHPSVEQAIQDVLSYGPSHSMNSFWESGYADMMGRSGVDIGGNRYFNK